MSGEIMCGWRRDWSFTCPHCGSDQVRVVVSKVKPAFMICLNCHFSDSKMEGKQ